MKRICITFSGADYDETTRQIVERAPQFGADEVWVYDDVWLMEQPFYTQNIWLWEHHHKRGFGWYAWKPFIIWHALSRLDEGDIVLYVDADTYPIAPFGMLFDRCVADGGMMLFASEGHRQIEWCKSDCYVIMAQVILNFAAPAGVARFMLFQKGPWRPTQFLMEWITYCVNYRATTFDPSVYSNELPAFIEHRTEQAIMTNLAHKYGLYLYREACQSGKHTDRDQALYGQLFHQVNKEDKTTAAAIGSAYANIEPRSVYA